MAWWHALLLMIAGLLGLMATGMPVAFAFGLVNVVMLFFVVAGVGALQAVALSSYNSIASFVFTAIPMFLLMGTVMTRVGLVESSIIAVGKLTGRVPGRWAVISVVSGTILGGASGSSMADTAALGTVLIPEMLRRGYSKRLATGCVAICGALAVLIPPSSMMVILAGISRLPTGDLLIGGLVPGLLLASLVLVYVIILAILKPELAPADQVEKISWTERLASFRHLLPIVGLTVIVLGSMFGGVATPTEAAAMGAFGAFGLGAAFGRLTLSVVKASLIYTAEVTALALFILTTASAFSEVLAFTGAGAELAKFATELPVSPWLTLVAMQFIIFVMGTAMDEISILLITVPLFFPIVIQMGFDPIWFAVVTMVNIELALLTPPHSILLFVLKGVCPPEVTTEDIWLGILPFLAINIVALGICMAFPPLVTWLPSLMH